MAALACTPVVSSAAISKQLPSPDAELIALGDQFNHLTDTWDELARLTIEFYKRNYIEGLFPHFCSNIQTSIT